MANGSSIGILAKVHVFRGSNTDCILFKRGMFAAGKHIRSVYAYTLLLVMAMQWLAGNMYLKVTYLIESTTEMSDTEQAIANDIKDQFGFDTQVNLIDASDMKFINGLGYAAPFVHALEVDGSMNTFTLSASESEYQRVEMVIKNSDEMQHEQKNKICLEKLFSQFCIGESLLAKNDNADVIAENNFSVISLDHIFDHLDPSPPPKLT